MRDQTCGGKPLTGPNVTTHWGSGPLVARAPCRETRSQEAHPMDQLESPLSLVLFSGTV